MDFTSGSEVKAVHENKIGKLSLFYSYYKEQRYNIIDYFQKMMLCSYLKSGYQDISSFQRLTEGNQ